MYLHIFSLVWLYFILCDVVLCETVVPIFFSDGYINAFAEVHILFYYVMILRIQEKTTERKHEEDEEEKRM